MSVKIRVLGDTQQEVMDYNKEKKSYFSLLFLTESQHHLMDDLPGFTICESCIHLNLQHSGICVSQCLIRMAWSEHPHSEKGAQQLLLQFCYP